MSTIYNREKVLQSRLNTFIQERFDLPKEDYYSRLNQNSLGELKSVLNDINSIFTLRVSLAFVNWLGQTVGLSAGACEAIKSLVLQKSPHANGYDVEISNPIRVIAEVKCNIPINRGDKYGSQQVSGIQKDINSLMSGKTKSQMKPDECLKFLVLLDTPEIRDATQRIVKKIKQHSENIVFTEAGTKPERRDKVYIVYVNIEA